MPRLARTHVSTPADEADVDARRRPLVSRRGLLTGVAAGAFGSGVEWASLRGWFDHRRAPAAAAKERFESSLRATDAGTSGIVHVGHSTHLLALAGMRLLTDPWFYDPAFGALSHEVPPAVLPSELGRLNAILVTHDHADHADLRAMDEMDKRATVIVATNDLAARVRARGFSDVVVLAPWEEHVLEGVRVTAVPGLHDIYEIGFVVGAAGKNVYFAGDSRIHPDLPRIAEQFNPTAAILPVDGTRINGAALHVMTPEDAVIAARTLGVNLVMPSHADAYFSDPLAGHLLASTVTHAGQLFAEVMAKQLPSVVCAGPTAGELVPF